MIRVKSKDFPSGLFVGFIFGIVIVLVVLFFKFNELYALFPVEEVSEKEACFVILANRDIEQGESIKEGDFDLIETNNYKDTGIRGEYLIGKKSAIKIEKNSVITYEMLDEDEVLDSDFRLYELDFIALMKNIDVGDVLDIRIAFPNGDDFTVLSGKKLMSIYRSPDGTKDYISLNLNERDILRLASAYNDYRLLDGVKIYTAKYVDADKQEKSVENYPVNKFVRKIIEDNVDVEDKSLLDNREVIERCYENQLKQRSVNIASESVFDFTEEELLDAEEEKNKKSNIEDFEF